MKKKSLIALLALVVACMLVFAACGDKADTDKGDSNADNTSASTELTTDENGEVFTPNEGTPVLPPSTPAPSTPEENTPVYSTGSVAYKYTQAGSDDYLAFVFMYDENQNVTEVMYTISGKNLSQEDIDELDEAYDSIEQAKDMGVNLNVDLINIDNEHRLDVSILVTGELDVAFVEGMLETDFAGTTIPLAEAEAAVIAQGFVKA